jgi:hypothetical protein
MRERKGGEDRKERKVRTQEKEAGKRKNERDSHLIRSVSYTKGSSTSPKVTQNEIITNSSCTMNLNRSVDHFESYIWCYYLNHCNEVSGRVDERKGGSKDSRREEEEEKRGEEGRMERRREKRRRRSFTTLQPCCPFDPSKKQLEELTIVLGQFRFLNRKCLE